MTLNPYLLKYLPIITLLLTTLTSHSQLIVDSPQPITHTVHVHRIVSAATNGDTATGFGNSAQEADIINKINQIWAQVGVEIIFSPVQNFTDNFTYNNNGAEGMRPSSHLSQILNLSNLPTTTSTTDIEMIFVESVPAFSSLSLNTAAGFARIDRSGTTVYVGSNLLNFENGRVAIASVMAHEIGHNLGLLHTANSIANLMSPQGTSDQFNNTQFPTILTNDLGIDGFDLLEESTPTLSNYEQFVIDFNIQGNPNDDDDKDGLSNLIEFSIGTNPTEVSNNLPLITQINTSEFRWSIPKNADAIEDNINYEIQFSGNLQNFTPAGLDPNSSIIANNDTQITAGSSSPNRGFFRLSVQQQAEAAQIQLAAQLAKQDLLSKDFVKPQTLCGCGPNSKNNEITKP